MLKEFKGIGDTGADIYLREVQDVWTWVRPYFDDRATAAAKQLGLPADTDEAGFACCRVPTRGWPPRWCRVSLDDDRAPPGDRLSGR